MQKLTNPKDHRAKRLAGEVVTLPGSGLIVRAVRPSLTALAATANGVPNPLSAVVLRLMASPPPKNDEERVENVKRNSRAFLEVAALCLVEPKLALDREASDDELVPEDLTNIDYAWLYYSFVEGTVSDIAPFRVTDDDRGDRPGAAG
jgi:hypothetical protein